MIVFAFFSETLYINIYQFEHLFECLVFYQCNFLNIFVGLFKVLFNMIHYTLLKEGIQEKQYSISINNEKNVEKVSEIYITSALVFDI